MMQPVVAPFTEVLKKISLRAPQIPYVANVTAQWATAAQTTDRTTVIYIQNDRLVGVPGYESWWDVAVAEVSGVPAVREAREQYERAVEDERSFV